MSIKCSYGGTHLSGSTLDIIQDFSNIIIAVRKTLAEKYSDDDVDKIIALSGKLAYASGDKEKELEVFEELTKVIAK